MEIRTEQQILDYMQENGWQHVCTTVVSEKLYISFRKVVHGIVIMAEVEPKTTATLVDVYIQVAMHKTSMRSSRIDISLVRMYENVMIDCAVRLGVIGHNFDIQPKLSRLFIDGTNSVAVDLSKSRVMVMASLMVPAHGSKSFDEHVMVITREFTDETRQDVINGAINKLNRLLYDTISKRIIVYSDRTVVIDSLSGCYVAAPSEESQASKVTKALEHYGNP